MALRDSERGTTYHRGGPALPLWTPRRLQEQPPPSRGHIIVHARPHRTTISPQCESHRRRHATRRPPGGIPGADQASREPPRGPAQHNTSHRTTLGPPEACRARSLAPDHLVIAKAEFDSMLRDGTARCAEGPWSSALHLVPKDSDWRPSGDYRALNTQTIPDRYPVPHLQDYSNCLSGCTTFSKIDLVTAYHQIPVHPQDIQNRAITTHFGLFEFPFMSFDLRNYAKPSIVSWMRSSKILISVLHI